MINYDELTPDECNRLIYEKIMGMPVPCNGQLAFNTYGKSPSELKPNDYVTWHCMLCHELKGCKYGMVPQEHAPLLIPHYSTDMNAAWQIVKEMNKPQGGSYDRYGRFIEELERLIGSNLLFDALNTEKGNASYALSCDSICIAALKVCGVIEE